MSSFSHFIQRVFNGLHIDELVTEITYRKLLKLGMDDIVPSFLIASAKPRELAEFYALVCNGIVSKGFNPNHYLIIYRENYKIQIYKPSTEINKPLRSLSAFSICFQKKSDIHPLLRLQEWCKEVVLLGAEIHEEARSESFGAEAWMKDPEGNTFLLFVPLFRSVTQ